MGVYQNPKHQSHLPSDTGEDEAPWPQQCGSTGQRVILWHNTLKICMDPKEKGEQSRKEERIRAWDQTDTADFKVALLGRGRKKKERGI